MNTSNIHYLTVIPGFLSSYPNFFFEVQKAQLPEFIAAIKHARSSKDKDAFYKKNLAYAVLTLKSGNLLTGLTRNIKNIGVRAGLFDLNRYLKLEYFMCKTMPTLSTFFYAYRTGNPVYYA
jgi:hypothetical protein